MSELFSMLSQALQGGTVSSMAQKIGADEDQTATAITAALPILIGALDRNSDQPGGANALFGALSRDHDGSILDDIGGFLGGSSPQASAGGAILGHILGSRQSSVESGLSRASGLDPNTIAKLLPMLAPIVMGAMGKVSRQRGLDAAGVSGYLTEERVRAQSSNPDAMSMLGSLLDSDNDGDITDDVMKLGTGLLGNFLKR